MSYHLELPMDLHQFHWSKADKGYEWQEAVHPEKGLYLVKMPGSQNVWVNDILKTSGDMLSDKEYTAFIDFAQNTPHTKEGFISFANRYGQLIGSGEMIAIAEFQESVFGTPINLWKTEHWDAVIFLKLWNWIYCKDFEKLKLVIQWIDNNTIDSRIASEALLNDFPKTRNSNRTYAKDGFQTNIPLRQKKISSNNTTDYEVFKLFKPGDLLLPALYFLQRLVNEKLELYPLNLQLLLDPRTDFSTDDGKNKPFLQQRLVPSSLLSALWYQFAQYISGERIIKLCRHCRKWQDVTGRRSNWTYHVVCGGTMRKESSRKQKKEADKNAK